MANPYSNNKQNSSKIIFVTGGTRSGKSEFTEHLAREIQNITYVALSEKREQDKIWEERILIHRKRRPKSWNLVETTNLISILNKEIGPILIDSIGGFVMENINKNDKKWLERMHILLELLRKRNNLTFIVGEQVGWGLVSEYKIGNIYIDRLGELQKEITRLSQDNWLTINGRAIKIDQISLEIPL